MRKSVFYISICLILLFKFFLSISINAQERFPMPVGEKGVSSFRYVYDINSDNNGLLWFVSSQGLSSYDGAKFKFYVNSDMSSKAGTCIVVDEKNRVWYNNFDGDIFYVEKDSLNILEIPKNEAINFKVSNDTLYFVHQSKLCKYYIPDKTLDPVYDVPKLHFVRFMTDHVVYIDPSGYRFIVSDFDGRVLHEFHLKKQFFSQIAYYKGKWFGLEKDGEQLNIYELNNRSDKPVLTIPKKVLVTNLESNGHILSICTKQGVIQVDLDNLQWGFRSLDASTLTSYIDSYDNEWIGTTNGLIQYSNNLISHRTILKKGVYDFNTVDSLLYVFDRNGDVYHYDLLTDSVQKIYTLDDPFRVYQLATYLSEHLQNALLKLHRTRSEHLINYKGHKSIILNSGSKEIAYIDDKYLAIALTGACEFIRIDNPNDTLTSEWDDLYSQYYTPELDAVSATLVNQVRGKAVAFDSLRKRLVFTTSQGVKLFTPEGMHDILLNEKQIYSDRIFFSDDKFVVLSSLGNLIIINEDNTTLKLNSITRNTPILFLRAYGDRIVFWNSNNLYIAHPSQLKSTTQTYELMSIMTPITPADISDLYFNNDILALIYNNEILTFDIKDINNKSKNFKFNWSSVKTENQIFDPKETIVLPSQNVNLDYGFHIIDFNHEVYSLEYQLNDGDWTPILPTDRNIIFNSITPGDYTLKIKINGVEQPEVVKVTKLKPWYNQYWFYTLILLAVSTGFIYYFKFRLKVQDKANKLLLEKNSLENSLRQSLLSSIKSQMNPHFLFNALNTIQSYIITEDKEKASRYLSLYAKLTRTILEMSDKEYVTLDAEIKAFNLYIELERMRFPDIEYVLKVDPNINTLISHIPSMIIQPFVENAIKHGLLHSQRDKLLKITIGKEGESLVITIHDNGIGRAESERLNQRRNKAHQSFATQANIKRLELLNLDKNDIVWEYKDLKDHTGEALGTEVLLKIPIKYYNND